MKKKKKPRGHGKGSGFERKIAKEIIKAYRKAGFKVKQNDCWRSVLSGGHEMSAGDLRMSAQMEKLFPYAVECKFYKKIKLENFLLGNKKSKEIQWLVQTMEGSRKSNKLTGLLVMKANRMKILTMRWLSYAEWKGMDNFIQTRNGCWEVKTWKEFLKTVVLDAQVRFL
jgi:hypothetical protein